jgi:hypothetical protein
MVIQGGSTPRHRSPSGRMYALDGPESIKEVHAGMYPFPDAYFLDRLDGVG